MIRRCILFIFGSLLLFPESYAGCNCSEVLTEKEFDEFKNQSTKEDRTYEVLGVGKELNLKNYSINLFDLKPSPLNKDECLCTYQAEKITSDIPDMQYFVVEEKPIGIASGDLIFEIAKVLVYLNNLQIPPRDKSTPEGQAFYSRRDNLSGELRNIDVRKTPDIPKSLVEILLDYSNRGTPRIASIEEQSKQLDALESDVLDLKEWVRVHKK